MSATRGSLNSNPQMLESQVPASCKNMYHSLWCRSARSIVVCNRRFTRLHGACLLRRVGERLDCSLLEVEGRRFRVKGSKWNRIRPNNIDLKGLKTRQAGNARSKMWNKRRSWRRRCPPMTMCPDRSVYRASSQLPAFREGFFCVLAAELPSGVSQLPHSSAKDVRGRA